MPVDLTAPVFLFIPETDRLVSDPELQDDLRAAATYITTCEPDDPPALPLRTAERAVLAAIDSQGRTASGLPALQSVGSEPWRAFSAVRPRLRRVRVAELPAATPPVCAALASGQVTVDGGRMVAELPWFPTNALRPARPASSSETVMVVEWPAPWDVLFPGISAVEALDEWARLHAVLRQAELGDVRGALAVAEAMLARRSMTATAPTTEAFWHVALAHDGAEELLFAAEIEARVIVTSVPDLFQTPGFIAHARRPILVTVVLGLLGYIWYRTASWLRHLSGLPRRCASCGTCLPDSVRAGTQFCPRRANPRCARQRHARQTRERRQRL